MSEDQFLTNPPKALIDKWTAEAENARAEAGLYTAQAEGERVEVGIVSLRAESIGIEMERERYRRRVELAQNEHNRTYHWGTQVDGKSMEACMNTLRSWMRMDAAAGKGPQPIELVFFSPGGSAAYGIAMWDYIQQVRAAGHYVTTRALGMAASMAGILLQAGDHRVMGRESWLLLHEMEVGMEGTWGQVLDRQKWLETIQDRIWEIYVDRSGGKITKARLQKLVVRQDAWIDAPTALKYGFIDEMTDTPYPSSVAA